VRYRNLELVRQNVGHEANVSGWIIAPHLLKRFSAVLQPAASYRPSHCLSWCCARQSHGISKAPDQMLIPALSGGVLVGNVIQRISSVCNGPAVCDHPAASNLRRLSAIFDQEKAA
jgi:hypothetical protein